MDKKIYISLTGLVVSGLLAMQGAPAQAQVQINGDGPPPSEAPPVQPDQRTQVNVTPAAPVVVPAPTPAPVVINNVSGEGRGIHRPAAKLMAAGGTLFGVTYLTTVLGAAIASDICQADSALGCREAAWPIYIPVIGPFIQMGYISGNGANTGRAILGIDGALQAGGLAMFIAGAAMWGTSAHSRYAQRVQITPYSTGTGTGLIALGRF
mgnify:CR=1 FL=1